MQNNEDRITTLEPGQKPTAKQIIDLLRESILAASAMDVFGRLERCHRTRECLWDGRMHDGRRGEDDSELPVFRWKGAPDVRIPMADKIVRWLTMLRMTVFNRGDLRIAPRQAVKAGEGDGEQDMAAVWQATMEHFADVGDWGLAKQYELWCTCVEEFGYGLVMTDWLGKQREEKCQVTVQALTDHLMLRAREAAVMAAAEALGVDAAEVTAEEVMTPEEMEALVTGVAEELEMMLAEGTDPSESQVAAVMGMDGRMTEAWARKVLKALARKPGEAAMYAAPRDDGGVVITRALVPWVNCLHPYDMKGDGKAEWFAMPEYWGEAKIRERALVERWDKAAVTELLENHKNQFFTEMFTIDGINVPAWAMNGTGIGLVPDQAAMEKVPRWMVIYVWMRVTTKAGRPMVYKGVVNPRMPDRLLMWEPTDLEELPLVCETAEPVLYAMMSKGVPEVVVDKQNFVKDTFDSEGARGQLGSNPPLLRTGATHVGVKPGIEMYAKRSGQSYDGTSFLEVPQVDQGSLALSKEAERHVNEYYCRGDTVSEEDKKMFVETMIFKARRCLRELKRLEWRQVQEHVTELQASRINGREVRLAVNRDQLQGEADIHIGVHMDGYSKDGAEKFIEVMGELIQADRSGSIDWAEATNIAAQLLSPTYARRLIVNAEAATGRTIDDQEMRIAKIMAGVPVRYEEKVSNPKLRSQVLQQWAAMPGNVQRAQTDPAVAEMLNKEMEMLQFQEQQQVTNPVIGRTGVKANAA